MLLTAHEEEQTRHILHEASVPAAAEHANDPAEKDDGHSHAHEARRHPAQVYVNTHKHTYNTMLDLLQFIAQDTNLGMKI